MNDFLNKTKSNPAFSVPVKESDYASNKKMNLNTKNNGHSYVSASNDYTQIEEKVAHLSLQINQVIVRPYLQQALEYLKSSKYDSINAYNQLSDEVATEVRIITKNSQDISLKLKDCQEVINRTQDIIRNKYNNASEEEISSGSLNLDYEYNIVAEHYELSMQLTQEISKYKSRIDTLLTTQSILDDSTVPSINRIQLEIDNLELLVHNFDSTDYADILSKKQGRNAGAKMRTTPSLEARSSQLKNLAEANIYANTYNYSQTPNVEDMRRYEDPSSQNINRARPEQYNNNYNSQMPLNRQELKLQKTLARQHAKIEEAKTQGKNDFYSSQNNNNYMDNNSNENYDNQYNNQRVYEKKMRMPSLSEHLKKSKTEKIFVVRNAEPVKERDLKAFNNKGYKTNASNLRNVRVIK